jgi:succinyl-CoA synthetase beta subunit
MRMFEFQAKRIFREKGIHVPNGRVATNAVEAEEIARELGGPFVLKAQVLVGGRGLAGGVKFANDPTEVRKLAEEIFISEIKGETVRKILVEKKVPIKDELYASVVIDQEERTPMVIASSEGGVEIESIAEKFPEKIIKREIDVFKGFSDFDGRSIAKKVCHDRKRVESFASVLKILYNIFEEYDAELVEINPLALTPNDEFVAVDAKLNIDARASFRHRELIEELQREFMKPTAGAKLREFKAVEAGLTSYFELNGNIGLICDGAGTGMLTLDIVKDLGGEPANFCELGGITSPTLMKNAMDVVLSNPKVEVLLINLIGGLNRMDEMAEGIISFLNEKGTSVPIVVRMTGTMEDLGKDMLRKAGISTYDNIYDAAEKVVELAGRK